VRIPAGEVLRDADEVAQRLVEGALAQSVRRATVDAALRPLHHPPAAGGPPPPPRA
jgi:hypothetical protein